MPIVVLPELFAFVVTDVHAPTVIASCAFLNSARFHGTHPDLQLATWWKPGQAECGLRSTATYTAATTEIAESRETPRSGCQKPAPCLYYNVAVVPPSRTWCLAQVMRVFLDVH